MRLFGELSTVLEARGVRGHVYLVGGGAFQVTVRDPDAVDEDGQQRGCTLYGEPHPIRTVGAANAAVNVHERHARAREGEAPAEAVLELRAVQVLRAGGERGRRYRAE